jgi:hypothetical protein
MHTPTTQITRRPLRAVLAAVCVPALLATCATVQEIQETPIELYLGTVRGRVLDDATGVPIPGARVYLVLDQEETVVDPRTTWSYEEGAFVFQSVEPGRYHLKAEARGYAAHTSAPLAVQQGELFRVTMRLEPQGR